MSRPWRDPQTGIYYLRKRVPKDLRALVGRDVYKVSLGTKDAAEAKRRHAKALAELESRWANLRAGPSTITEREAHDLAIPFHDGWLAQHGENPSQLTGWRTDLFDQLWAKPVSWDMDQPIEVRLRDIAAALTSPAREQEKWCAAQAEYLLGHLGRRVDDAGRRKLAKAIAGAVQRASFSLARAAQGDYEALTGQSSLKSARPSEDGTSAALATPTVGRSPSPSASLTLTGLMEAWWREAAAAGRKPSTRESYSSTIRSVIEFLKHEDASRVTAEDVVAFKDYRLTTPSKRTGRVPSAKTVKDSDLSALKTLFGWAVANRKLSANPAQGVTIKIGKPRQLRPKWFTDAEAIRILRAALDYVPGNERPCTAAAKRWVPLLCAFTGARVGEIAQLRREDVRSEGDLWLLHITPEAGTVKTDEARAVVLHPQILALGFLDFVTASAEGPLFLVPAEGGSVLGPLQGLKNRLAEFSRAIVPDPGVAPLHGWRHRFTSVCIEAEIDSRIIRAIQGHAARSVAESYGDVTMRAQAAAIRKLPWYDLSDRLPFGTGAEQAIKT